MKIATVPTRCSVCEIDDADWQFSAIDRLHGTPGEYQYVQCRHCRTLYLNPAVAGDDVSELYPESYGPHLNAPAIRAPRASPSAFGGISPRLLDVVRYHLVFRALYALKGMRLGRDVYRRLGPASRILDVGCGSGSYLNMLRMETGASVFGVDIAENAARTAKASYGIDIFVGPVERSTFPARSFDLITAWWYLEHVPEPRRVIQKMVELLKPGGICVIGVPNSRSFNRHLFRSRWYHLDTPRHFNLWTPAGLRRLCEGLGLRFVGQKCDRTPWGLLGSLQYALLGNNFLPLRRNLIRGNPVLAALLLPWTIAVSLLGGSDLMVQTFTMPPGGARTTP